MSKARDLADGTFDTDTLVVDAANNRVGVGTASPSAALHVYNSGGGIVGLVEAASGYNARMRIQSGNANESFLEFADPDDSDVGEIVYDHSSNSMRFNTNATEAMRIDSSGKVGVGRTDPATYVDIYTAANSVWGERVRSDLSGTQYFITFEYGGSSIGSIQGNNTSTSYNTTSDYRLKENVTDLTGASDRINQIPVHRFNFIANPDTTVDGFLAHEVQDIVPESVTGTHNEVDEDGNPVYQQIDQAKIVPLLTAALQEALSEIADLKTRVAALETP